MCAECLVDRGVDALVDYFGGMEWVHEIDSETLNLSSTKDCILGQLFGDYGEGLDALGIAGGQDAYELGLTPWGDGNTVGEIEVRDAWIRRLRRLQEGFPITHNIRPQGEPLMYDTHSITVTVELTLTAEQIGRLYIEGQERGLTVEEVLANELGYHAETSMDF